MKFPRKLRPMAVAFAIFGLAASASAFAVPTTGGSGATLPPGAKGLPNYYVVAGALDNPAYIACIQAHMKPGPANVVIDVNAAIDCQNAKN
jgi:hypothetical protein